jgi:hypothetical protein
MEITEISIDEQIFEARLKLGWMEHTLDFSMDSQEIEARVDEIMTGRIRLAILEVGARLLREKIPPRVRKKRARAERIR